MLDAYIIDWRKRQQERKEQNYDDGRPRADIGIPNGSLIDDRKENYERWRDQQTPQPEYEPVPVNLDIAMPYQSMNSHNLEGRL